MNMAQGSQRNVLICVDGSEHSNRAVNFYLEALHLTGDHVIVFHAEEIPTMSSGPGPYGFANFDEFQHVVKRADAEAEALLRNCGDIIKSRSNIRFKLVKEDGKAGERICSICQDENIHLIVMGSRGLGTVRRTLIGSVSDYVVHHSHRAVCVVPPQARHQR